MNQLTEQLHEAAARPHGPIDMALIARRARRHRRSRRLTIGAVSLAAVLIASVSAARLATDDTTVAPVSTATTTTTLPFDCPPQSCEPGPDGYSDRELQYAGIDRTNGLIDGYTSTYTESEVFIGDVELGPGYPDDLHGSGSGTLAQRVSPREVERRVEAVRSGESAQSQPDLDVTAPCLRSSTSSTARPEFLGLAPGFAQDLALRERLNLRTVGTNGVCNAITLDLRLDRVNIDVVDGRVVGASIG